MLSFPQLLELRITARQVALNFHAFRLARRTLCSDAGVKLPGADSAQEVADKHGHHSNIPIHDVAIVGGGMVGMALACSLARMPLTNQLNVAIIDSNPALLNGDCIQKEDPPDPRVSTVTPATIDLFKDVGAWRYVEQHRHAYFDKMQVWDYTGFGYTRYNARDINKEILGCVVENKVLHRSLLSCLQIWEDILGFENAEFYIKRWPDLDGLRFEDVLVSFPDAIPCGVKVFADGGKIKINPDDNYILREGDEILVIAEDDDTYAPDSEGSIS